MPGMPVETTIALASIADTMREGLLAFTTAAGLAVFRTLLDDELASKIGPKHVDEPFAQFQFSTTYVCAAHTTG